MNDLPAGSVNPVRTYELVPALLVDASPVALQALASHPLVASVTPNFAVYAQLEESSQLINAAIVHQDLGRTGEGVVVAVLDTGVDTDHPMLEDDIIYQRCYLVLSGCPGGGTSGFSAEDGHSHGTHVTGIITSDGPPLGIAPGAKIKAFKILSDVGEGTMSDILAAYDEILSQHGDVRIINMSLGDEMSHADGSCESLVPAMTDALTIAASLDIMSVAAAGNTGSKSGLAYPACLQGVTAVGAVYDADMGALAWSACVDASTAANQVTCFSQSSQALTLLAPGALVTSTVVGGGLAAWGGTSMAAPVAAAVAALVLEAAPALSVDALVARLQATGVPITDVANGVTTCRVNALGAVVNDVQTPCSGPDSDEDGLPDWYEELYPCLDGSTPDGAGDADADGLTNLEELGVGTDPCAADTDGDGCADSEEVGANPTVGGGRNPLHPLDFPDLDHDLTITILDLGIEADAFQSAPSPPALDLDGDGTITILDLAEIADQFLDSCAAPP